LEFNVPFQHKYGYIRDERRLRKTLHRQTDRHYENIGHLALNQ